MTKILIVEDNELNLDMLSRRLEQKGYEILSAMDGRQGVDKAKSESPDLIIMDMSLPEISGWEAARILKEELSTSKIPIIALTAHAMLGDKEKAIQSGCDDFDTKPVDLGRLLGKIDAALNPSSITTGSESNDKQNCFNKDFDESVLRDMRDNEFGGDPMPIRKLVETYIENGYELQAKFNKAVEAEDAAEIARIAHMLKGSSLSVGANKLGHLWANAEKEAKTGSLENIISINLDLKKEIDRALSALAVFLQ